MSDSDLDSRPTTPLPEAGNDAADPSQPRSDDGDTPPPAAANPDLDMVNIDDDDHDSLASDLSEVDEAEFADFDPTTVALEDRPLVDIDEDVAKTLKASKRQRADKGEGKKGKEGKRDKKKRRRDEDEDPDGQQMEGKRARKPRPDGERKIRDGPREKRAPSPENEENLTPEERRRRALDKQMDAALKNPNKRRRKRDEVDLEEAFDDEIANVKIRMEQACVSDNQARENNQPAIHKLKMLPDVLGVLNRNTVQHTIVDPDTNFLQSVKYFLEPLSDGSLPAYNIQRDLFAALTKLPIEKEALLSSGIGKIVLFYTKSKKPEPGVKRTAERLLGDWSRPILKRTDDFKQRKIATREFDYQAAQLALRPSGPLSSQMPAPSLQDLQAREREMERKRALAQPLKRTRVEASTASYSIAPKSTFDPTRGLDPMSKPIGAGGMEAFRKMTTKQGKKRN
ncbi:putative transcription factor IWS1 [Amylocarpus encephaloides]|uniref:Transcription factor IWS1 n=1 Tax=Amylocarpus encephaloides TaxID=45428 RepID=A0A9P7YDD7_9HELO|nr:putative transcription factor IWS1 [Amylocarpus encephaloides]